MADNPRIEELRRRVQKDPASIAFAQLAEEFRRAGNYEEAVRVCRTGLAKHPSYLSARVTLGRALIELEQYDEARTELEYVLRSAPENLSAVRGLAEIHQRRGELTEALKHYQAALGIAKHDPDLEESVHTLTRQLGSTPGAPPLSVAAALSPSLDAFTEPVESAATAALPQAATVFDSAPPIPPAALEPEPAPPPELEIFGAPTPTVTTLSPALEAAADEFTKALEALDALTIELPKPQISSASLALPDLPPLPDDRLVPAQEWELEGFEAAWAQRDDAAKAPPEPAAAPAPVPAAAPATTSQPAAAAPAPGADPALGELEAWLDSIVMDRGASATDKQS